MKYPKGAINQHKKLATSPNASQQQLQEGDTSDKEYVDDAWGKNSSHPGSVRKSGTSTGSGSGTGGMPSGPGNPGP
jgi:hypothetical protein